MRWLLPILLLAAACPPSPSTTSDDDSVEQPTPPPGRDGDGPCQGARKVHVDSVTDGDTINVDGAQAENGFERVRLIGIDTPEISHGAGTDECFGPEAADHTTELLDGQQVWLCWDTERYDRYGRSLCYVYLDTLFVNLHLVEEGFAFAYPFEPNTRYANTLQDAEDEARSAGLGLWGACNVR